MSGRLVVIGNGGFAVRCLKLMLEGNAFTVPLVIADPSAHVLRGVLEKYCSSQGLPLLHTSNPNEDRIVDAVRATEPDFLFSVYNMQLLTPKMLSLPHRGAINFHNGPLPRYRGVNVYSWAILNGETSYGVTWHLMAGGIDAGHILAQQMFELRSNDTPTTLMQRGFDAGVASLAHVLNAIRDGSLRPQPQDESAATYYSRKHVPHAGRLDFSWSFERLERFARALDFRPLPNTFVRPTAFAHGRPFHPQSIRFVETGRALPAGRVCRIDERMIWVQAGDCIVGLTDLLDVGLVPSSAPELADSIGLRVGDRLA